MYKILVVDDHFVVRHGIIRILEERRGLELICEEASTSEEALQKLSNCQYQAILLDISLNDENGLDLLPKLKQIQPSIPILIVSMHPEELYAIHALSLGAAGYLTKNSAPDILVDAVSNVLSGQRFISASLASSLADHLAGDQGMPSAVHDQLSPREFQILRKIGSGRTPTEISKSLFLSVKTISTYRVRILKKMGMRTSAELMKYAITQKLVD